MPINNYIVKLYTKNNDKITRIGSGFLINKLGYFITARHNIEPNFLDKETYYCCYKSEEYQIQRVSSDINYSLTNLDVIIYKIFTSNKCDSFAKIKYINEQDLSGIYFIYGYPNNSDKLKQAQLEFYGLNTATNLLEFKKKEILTGCSGSPIVKKHNNGDYIVVGIMNNTNNSVINVSSINLIEKLGFKLKKEIINNRTKITIENFCKKINFYTIMRLYNPYNTYNLIFKLHDKVEHILIYEEQNLVRNHKSYTDKEFRDSIKNILLGFKEVMDIFSKDVSINIKAVYSDNSETGGKLFHTIVRVDSYKEKESSIRREFLELFDVYNDLDINNIKKQDKNREIKYITKTYYKDTENEITTDLYIRTNSAYNQACYNSKKFYLCNNLKLATSNNEYYSTSQDYDKFYNSIIVFPICKKKSNENINLLEDLKGILIIDSYTTGVFNKKFTMQLGGYLSHKLYRYLSNSYFETFFDKKT